MTDEELIERLRTLLDRDNGFGMSCSRLADFLLCDYTYIGKICKRELPLAPKTRNLIIEGIKRIGDEFDSKIRI